MKMDPKEIGAYGEQLVARHMGTNGCMVLGTNYSCNDGEIDVIALEGDILVFTEVKTRKKDAWVSGEEAITREKQRKILKTALHYLEENQMDLQPRFDVGVVVYDEEGTIEINYIKAAFDGSALQE